MFAKIFINYRRDDGAGSAGRIYDHLARSFAPSDVFLDCMGIQPGDNFPDKLKETVTKCEVFIAVIGPKWKKILQNS